MEIRQLEVFVCVAKSLSFSRAAEEMYVSQPTVSAYISSLEKSVGAQLLIRSTKGVSLSKTGIELLAYAQKILSLRDQAIQSASGTDRSTRGTLDIIASTIPAQHLLPEIIASFQTQWRNITFRVDQADSRQVENEMKGFRYDFGFMGTLPDDDRFSHHMIYADELVLIAPISNDMSSDEIRENFADFILKTPFVMRKSGSGTRAEIESLLLKIGVNLRDLHVPAYFSDAHSILLAVSRGMGVSLVSKIATAMYVEAGLLKVIEMDSPLFRRQIYMLYNKEMWLSPAQQAFAEHVKRFYVKTVEPPPHRSVMTPYEGK